MDTSGTNNTNCTVNSEEQESVNKVSIDKKDLKPKKGNGSRKIRKKKPKAIQLTPRDLEIFVFIGRNTYVNTSHIHRLFFKKARMITCRARLKLLFDNAYLSVMISRSTEENIYSITKKALAEVKESKSSTKRFAKALKLLRNPITISGIPHHRGVVDAFIFTHLWAKQQDDLELLGWARGKSSLAEELKFSEFGLQPDALALMDGPQDWFVIAVEIDLGSEDARTIRAKLAKYLKVLHAHPEYFKSLYFIWQGDHRRGKLIEKLFFEHDFPASSVNVYPLAFIQEWDISR